MNIKKAIKEIEILVSHSDNTSYRVALEVLKAATADKDHPPAGVVAMTIQDIDILDEALEEWLDDTQMAESLTELGMGISRKINNLREGLL